MKRRYLVAILWLVFTAFFFYVFSVGKTKSGPRIHWQGIIPSYITDSIYFDTNNSSNEEKIELGHYLFYDRRLSINKSKSCASCHDQKFSFTDSYRRSIGALGDLHQRNASPLINVIFRKYLTAADSNLHYPEQQIKNPMFHDKPIELGWTGNEADIIERIKKDDFYKEKFRKVFPDEEDPVTIKNIQYSITTFVKSIVSFNSAYDQFFYLKKDVLTASEKTGMQLFFSKELGCAGCHGGSDFATPALKDSAGNAEFYFNTGLYNLNNLGAYPAYDQGLADLTKNPADIGKYKVPVLRNLAFTAPYFHDGSAATLNDVVAVYENGGRNVITGAYKGNGRNNPHKHPLIKGFKLNSQERKDLVSFLLSLSDSSVLTNPAYANPFSDDETKKNYYP